MDLSEKYEKVLQYFKTNIPVAETELLYTTPYQLAVAVLLSAQCTDKRVNQTTPAFFAKFPNAESLSIAQLDDVFALIKSCSYPNNKAKHLIGMAQMLVNDFNGTMPENIEDLQKLPGIGRKSANVITAVAFNNPAMPVDTHVQRVSARIGLTKNAKTPLETEKQLVKNIPQNIISTAHHWLILHGRYVCVARKPKCTECGISLYCDFYQNNLNVQ